MTEFIAFLSILIIGFGGAMIGFNIGIHANDDKPILKYECVESAVIDNHAKCVTYKYKEIKNG